MAASDFSLLQQHLANVCAFAILKHTHHDIVEMHQKFSIGANFALKSLQKGIFFTKFGG